MLAYKSAYQWEGGICLGEVLDFPGTFSFGQTLDKARANLAGALRDMAETNVLRGEPLPTPTRPGQTHRRIWKSPSTWCWPNG